MEDRIIMDSFCLKEPNFAELCDSSLDKSVVDFRIKVYNDRAPMERVYRLLHDYGILIPENKYVLNFQLKGNAVYFELSINGMLEENPNLDKNMKSLLKGEMLEFWERLMSIGEMV